MSDIQRITLETNTIAYRVAGAGPDVLLIHGWTSSGDMWEALLPTLTPHFRVWAIDLMGFGDSRNADDLHALSVAEHAELVADFCQALDMVPYAVVGHSMGGAVALQLAITHPDMMSRLILVSTVIVGRFGWVADRLFESPLEPALLPLGEYIWPLARVALRNASPFIKRQSLTRMYENLRKATWAAAYGGLRSMHNIHLDQHLDKIQMPVYIITGSQDNVVSPADSRTAAKLIAGAQLLELPGIHHHPLEEEPDRFREAVLDFLEAVLESEEVSV